MIPNNIKQLMQALLDKGFESYIIGGAVRDKILEVEPHDYDIFTSATGKEILEIFPQGRIMGGEERQAKILTVIVDGVEISQYRSNGNRIETGIELMDHLATCDFTINAMAMDIEGNITDPFEGREDIRNRTLRFVGDPVDRISEDPLRIFRGLRFKAKYNFDFEFYNNSFSDYKDLVTSLPKERIRDELMKIIQIKDGLSSMSYYSLFSWIIPEWEKCKGLDGGLHHNECLDTHMKTAYAESQKLTNNPLLMLAIFLHDIGKPQTKGTNIKDEITFYDHQVVGAGFIGEWMKEYKFSLDEIKYVTTIIKHHMMGKTGDLSQRTFVKICDELNNAKVSPFDMLVCTYCDNQANLKNSKITYNEFIKDNGFLQRYYETMYSRRGFNENDLELNGKDLIELGYEPGKIIGVMKRHLFDLVCEGKLINRRDRLIEYVKTHCVIGG